MTLGFVGFVANLIVSIWCLRGDWSGQIQPKQLEIGCVHVDGIANAHLPFRLGIITEGLCPRPPPG